MFPIIAFGQWTSIPDQNFEQRLINLGYDNLIDGQVLSANISGVTNLNVSYSTITDLTGIEDFIALIYFNFSNNQLTSLDLSQNTALATLNCSNNYQLTSLDLSNNTSLTTLYCQSNQLTSLDVSQNTSLTYLNCNNNPLTTLDLYQNTALSYLSCNNNRQLMSLDLSQNILLDTLLCYDNQLLANLDLSQNTALTFLYLIGTGINSLNLTQNTALSELYIGGNWMTSLDLSQNTSLTYLYSGNNISCLNLKNGNNNNIVGLDIFGTSCVEVDDPIYSNTNWVNDSAIGFAFLIGSFYNDSSFSYSYNTTFSNNCNYTSDCFSKNRCLPATATTFLDLNNVSALIENGGSMWQDRSRSDAAYEVPKGSGETVIYAGSIWMGGKDVNNQLHLSGLTFRSGESYWPGPLTVYDAKTYDSTCREFDRVWKINKWQVEEFAVKYQDQTYTIPEPILSWPANGNTQQNYAQKLAPFHDENNDGNYNPYDGDYPEFDINKTLLCDAPKLYGDQCIYYIMNDAGNVNTESGGLSTGSEIHAQAFAYRGNPYLDNSTFYNYKIINRSLRTYGDFYFGNWIDSDIGCNGDDYVGCDIPRGLSFQYNADAVDDGCQYAIQGNPPAVGIDFIKGPLKDADGLDNPLTSDVNIAYNQGGIPYPGLGIGYGDGIIDNERMGMQRFVYFDRTLNATIYGDPKIAIQYYNYMRGFWKNNTPFVFGGTGNQNDANATSILTNYCFPGDSDPLNWATVSAGGVSVVPFDNWSEQYPIGLGGGNPNPQGDRRSLQSVGPFTFSPQDTIDVTFAVIYAKDTLSTDPYQSVEKVKIYDDSIQKFADNCFKTNNCLELIDGFQYQYQSLDYHFAYEMEADSFSWTFGDGGSSSERFPKHTYANNGNYTVCVTAQLVNCGTVTHCKVFQNVSIRENIDSKNISIYPNPTNDFIKIKISNYNGNFNTRLYDFTGKILQFSSQKTLKLIDYPKGIYFLRVSYGDITKMVKVIKQ